MLIPCRCKALNNLRRIPPPNDQECSNAVAELFCERKRAFFQTPCSLCGQFFLNLKGTFLFGLHEKEKCQEKVWGKAPSLKRSFPPSSSSGLLLLRQNRQRGVDIAEWCADLNSGHAAADDFDTFAGNGNTFGFLLFFIYARTHALHY